jgi:hypothetical protein
MIRLINLNEHKNKFGLEAHQEARERKEIIGIFDLIKIDYPDLSMETCKIIELSSEVVVSSILELLRKNMGSRRMRSVLDISYLYKIIREYYYIFLKWNNLSEDENLLKDSMNYTIAYLHHWLFPMGGVINVTDRRIILQVNILNMLYKSGVIGIPKENIDF